MSHFLTTRDKPTAPRLASLRFRAGRSFMGVARHLPAGLFAIAVAIILARVACATQDFGADPRQIEESKPIALNGAKFVAVAETKWKPAAPDPFSPRLSALEIQLRITNTGAGKQVFPTFDTFGLTVKKVGGAEIEPEIGRDLTIVTRPVSIAAGGTYTICRKAQLGWDGKRKAAVLIYEDGTGSAASYENLLPGEYRIGFWYSTTSAGQRPAKRPKGRAIWSGAIKTNDVLISIAAPPAR